MNIITKGSKPVVYKSNMRLKLYSGAIEDEKVSVAHLFVKLMPDSGAVVFGEYTIFLLFSYLNNKNKKEYITESQSKKFSEVIACNLPVDLSDKLQFFDAHATFEPRVSCKSGTNDVFDIKVEGEIDVSVYDEKVAPDLYFSAAGNCVKSDADSATIVPLKGNSITADELLEMDTEIIKQMSGKNSASSDTDKQES